MTTCVSSPGFAETVIYNPLNNTTGGSTVTATDLKSLSFQTGSLPTKLNTLTIGLNPKTGSAPTTAKVTISIWSTNSAGVPTAPLRTLVSAQTVTINSTSQSYTFNLSPGSAPLLNANTKYAIVLSSDSNGIKWANNADGSTATGENGFTYVSQLVSTDSGDSWTSVGAASKNTILAEIFTIPYNALMPQSYAGFLSVGLEALKRQRELMLSEAGECELNGWTIDNSKSKNKTNSTKHESGGKYCFNALATNSSSYINGNDTLFSYQSGITAGYYLLEYKASPLLKLGVAYGNGNAYLNSMPETNAAITANVNSGSLYGIYKTPDNLAIRALIGYANFNAQSSRNVDYLANGVAVTGSPNANGYTAAIDAKYTLKAKDPNSKNPFYLAPKLGIAWGGYSQQAFVESGVDYLNLSVDSHMANSVVATIASEIGTRPIKLNKSSSLAFRPKASIGYQVDMLGNDASQMTLTQSFASSPSAGTFAVQGQNRGVNNLYLEGGLDVFLNARTALYASTAIESFSTGSQFSYQGGIRVAF